MEVEELPAGWVVASLDDLLTKVSNGANVVQYEDKIGYPISRIETIWNESIDLGRVRYIRESDAEFVEKYALQHGDILFSHINSDAHLGKTALFRSQAPILIHGINLLLLRPGQGVSPEFLNYQFKYLRFRGAFIDAAQRAVNQSSINQKKLKSLEFVVPPTAEQHRIVTKIEELFSELDQGVASLKTAREQLKVYRQSLLKNAFEGKRTAAWRAAHADQLETAAALQQRIARERQARYQQQLADWQTAGQAGSKPKPPKPLPPLTAEELAELPELPEGWGWFKLAGVSDVSGGLTKNQKREQLSLTRPYLRVANVYANRLELGEIHSIGVTESELERVTLEKGDLLIVEGNGSIDQIGRVALWADQISACVHQNHIIKARPLRLAVSKFLLYFLMSELGRKFIVRAASSTSGLHTLSISKVEGLFVPLCSSDEQAAVIAELESKLSEADQLDQTLATALQQADALRQSILKKAFCGQLVEQDKNDEPATVLLERIRAARCTEKPARRGRSARSQL